jgi:hypothetical protein
VKRLALWVCLVAVVVGAVEGIAAVATWMLWRRGHMPRIVHLADAEVLRLLRMQSQRFGWLPPLARPKDGFVVRARPDPAFAEDAPACASAYGDSFTFGTPVGDDATFPHDLGVALGCRVSNFGMPGYGSDQAFLLYRAQRDADRAPIVILAHLTENVLRNVNQYRELLYPGGGFGFKPRLRLDERGKLRRVPLVDAGPAFVRRLGARDPTTLYDGGRYGHLTAEGYAWLADEVREAIGRRAN